MDRQEIKVRMNGIPVIDKQMLRGGMANINLRKEIKRYETEVNKFNNEEIVRLSNGKESRSVSVEKTIPKMKQLRNSNLGWFI